MYLQFPTFYIPTYLIPFSDCQNLPKPNDDGITEKLLYVKNSLKQKIGNNQQFDTQTFVHYTDVH